jgi:hypothetical protein
VSRTTPGAYGGFAFWVYDVCKGILLAEMAGIAESTQPRGWLARSPTAA